MTVIDVFMFDDEFDMLRCRLYQLQGLVDRFILIEGDYTMAGEPKPLHFSERQEEFAAYPIEVVRAGLGDLTDIEVPAASWNTPDTMDAWRRDAKQRDAAAGLLGGLPGDTTVIYGDLDEIPLRGTLENFEFTGPCAMSMTLLMYSVALAHPTSWQGPVIGPLHRLGLSAAAVRGARQDYPRIPSAGWHLSWFGTPEDRIRKMHHFAHQELRDTVGDDIGSVYPAQHRHVDGAASLRPYDGPLPSWIEDGWAPASWVTVW